MIEVFRLALKSYARPLSGKGAAISGGRWNSVGNELSYTASNRSLAMVEMVVHMPSVLVPPDYVMLTIGILDDVAIEEVKAESLSRDWSEPPYLSVTRIIGDRFANANQSCVLRVPSAVTRGDTNLLLNPVHRDFARIKILNEEDFSFDKRLL